MGSMDPAQEPDEEGGVPANHIGGLRNEWAAVMWKAIVRKLAEAHGLVVNVQHRRRGGRGWARAWRAELPGVKWRPLPDQ